MSLFLRTARRFNTVLSAKFYDMALTYTRTTGETVLLWAALHNREATFKSLLERGADVSIQDKDGDTVLHHLATKGNLHLLTPLLRHSHDVDIRKLKVRPVNNSSWKSIKITEYHCKAEEELEQSASDAVTTWGDMGKDSRNPYILQPRKAKQTSSNSFSTLALTLRLQRITKGPHYNTLRLKIMKMCSNYFCKRV